MLGLGKNEKPLSNVYLDSYSTYSITFNERALLYDATNHDRVLGIDGNYLYSYRFTGSNGDASRDLVIHRQHICNTELAFDDSRALKPITNSRVEYVATYHNAGDFVEGDAYPVVHAYGYYWMLTSFQYDYTSLVRGVPSGIQLMGVAWRIFRIKDDFSECGIAECIGSQAFGLSDDYDARTEKKMIYQLDRQAGFFPTGEDSFSMYACFGHDKDSDHNSPYFTFELYRGEFSVPTGTIVRGGVVHSYSETYNPAMNLFSNIYYHANGVSCGKNWIGTEDGDIWECEVFNDTNGRSIGCTDNSMFGIITVGGEVRVGRVADYLASINNLNSPVTKDNTQNMKLIYTLTFTD